MDQQEHDAFVKAAFDITLSKMLDLHVAERKHLLVWVRAMLKDKTEAGVPRSREVRQRMSHRIADLYGKPRGFCRNLRIQLWERNMKPRDLVALMGQTKNRVSYWLAGTAGGGKKHVAKVARALGLSEEELMPIKRRRRS